MKRKYIIALVVGALLSLAAVIGCVLASQYVQEWLLVKGVGMLEKKLGTEVRLDSVSVSMARRELVLYGFTVEDRQKVPMLAVDTLRARMQLLPLLHRNVEITEVSLHGVKAVFYKNRRDTAANYQFAVDVFKSKKKADGAAPAEPRTNDINVRLRSALLDRMALRWDIRSERKRGGDTLDMNHLLLDGVHLRIDGMSKNKDAMTLMLSQLKAREKKSGIAFNMAAIRLRSITRRGVTLVLERGHCTYRDQRVGFVNLAATQQGERPSLQNAFDITADTLTYWRDNHRPHKRTGKPHRGYFDPGHLDVAMNVQATVDCITRDSIKATVRRLWAHDRASGLLIRNFTGRFAKRGDQMTLAEARINLDRSSIYINKVSATLARGNGHRVTDIMFQPASVMARVTLADIAKPFAPVLSDFTTPLMLNVTVGGTLQRMTFGDIRVTSRDKRLLLTAQGDMTDVLKHHELQLHFSDIRLDARHGIKETIVRHFSKKVRMKMIRQMRKIGDIHYRGNLAIRFKREDIDGTLQTKYGDARFAFTIDGRTKLMTGNISTDSLALGSIMQVKGLGNISANATYCFNVASKRTRPAPHNGRLPIGWLKANVANARFKGMNFKDITADMHSDGATAEGEMLVPTKLFDISLRFWYTQTDSVQNLKFKPRLLKRKKTDDVTLKKKTWKDYLFGARRKARDKQKAQAMKRQEN